MTLPKQGDRVRIKKGAVVYSTGALGERVAKRSYVVTAASDVLPGVRGWGDGRPQVRWSGAGGYWCRSSDWEAL